MSATTTSTREEQERLLPSSLPPSDGDGQSPAAFDLVKVRRMLYLSHFLSTWNARSFEFAAVLYLSALFPDTLLPMSVYANVRGVAVILSASAIGDFIDRRDRLRVMQFSIVWQRIAVAISCALFLLLFHDRSLVWPSIALLCLLACAEKVCATINMVSSEKDWLVVISHGSQPGMGEMSAQMRTIDLICKLIGPLFIASIAAIDMQASVVLTLVVNLVCVMVEMRTTEYVYNGCPALQERKASSQVTATERRSSLADMYRYCTHRAFLPSFSGALLYCTVLSFGAQMVAYLLAEGYSSTQVAVARTASVVFELLAMRLGPSLIQQIGAPRAGLWSLNFQMTTLAIGVAIFVNRDASTWLRTAALVLSTIFSRVGLRGSELSVQLIVQENVMENERGSFSSMEAAWQNVFELVSYTLTIAFSKPSQFHWPVIISLAAVASSLCLYTVYVRMHRGHLFHVPCRRSR